MRRILHGLTARAAFYLNGPGLRGFPYLTEPLDRPNNVMCSVYTLTPAVANANRELCFEDSSFGSLQLKAKSLLGILSNSGMAYTLTINQLKDELLGRTCKC
jgi:hypothetical protein